MSDLGDKIQTAIDEFNDLATGDNWRSVQEGTFLPALQGALNDAAAESDIPEDTRTDVGDSSGTVVADAEGVTITADGAADVDVSDNNDGTVSVTVSATDTNTQFSGSHDDLSGVGAADHHDPDDKADAGHDHSGDSLGGSDPLSLVKTDQASVTNGLSAGTTTANQRRLDSGGATDKEARGSGHRWYATVTTPRDRGLATARESVGVPGPCAHP